MKKLMYVIILGVVIWLSFFIADIYDWPPRPKTEFDQEILSETINLLSSEAAWNKNDNRQCPGEQTKLSLYCALYQASKVVSGSFHHESAVMEAVRDAIEIQTPNVKYSHILMDFNNSPSTSLNDIHEVISIAKMTLQNE
jgi:hypothetical protein